MSQRLGGVCLALAVLGACSHDRFLGQQLGGAGVGGSGTNGVGGGTGFTATFTSAGVNGASGTGGSAMNGAGGGGMLDEVSGAIDPDAALRAAVFLASCKKGMTPEAWLGAWYTARGITDCDIAVYSKQIGCFQGVNNGCAAISGCLDAADQLCAKDPPLMQCSVASDACANDVPTWCDGMLTHFGVTCGEYGLTCGLDPGFSHTCMGTLGACNPKQLSQGGIALDQGLACQDNAALRACVNGGEAVIACGTLGKGFTCQPGSALCGLADACNQTTATSNGTPSTCVGDSIVVCNAGRVDTIDCTTLGFSGCSAGLCVP